MTVGQFNPKHRGNCSIIASLGCAWLEGNSEREEYVQVILHSNPVEFIYWCESLGKEVQEDFSRGRKWFATKNLVLPIKYF